MQVYEPLLLLGKDRCSKAGTKKSQGDGDTGETSHFFALLQVDIRLRVKGGGFTGQIYALRQAELRAMPLSSCSSSAGIFRKAVAKGIVAYYQKFIDEVPRS